MPYYYHCGHVCLIKWWSILFGLGLALVGTHVSILTPYTTGTTKENFLALPLDVTSTDAITSAIAKAQETFGRLDVVVNNAFVFIIPLSMS